MKVVAELKKESRAVKELTARLIKATTLRYGARVLCRHGLYLIFKPNFKGTQS